MVGLKPWGIQPFIDFSISEITNQNLNLRDIFPSEIRTLQDELRTAQADETRVRVIENFLLCILRSHKPDPLVAEAVKQISRFNGQLPVRDLAERFHLCEKQFKRRFARTVGITPKLFSRLLGFQHILNLMDNAHVKPQRRIKTSWLAAGF
jgi:AraC-like DNA-binding protein